MLALVQAGAVDELSDKSGERNRLSMRIRQQAQSLARQAQKQGADDDMGGELDGDDEEGDEE
jgi:hypothetical protein